MADFDVQGARQAGYTDAEIEQHLASQGWSPKAVQALLRPPQTLGTANVEGALEMRPTPARPLVAKAPTLDTSPEAAEKLLRYVIMPALSLGMGGSGGPAAMSLRGMALPVTQAVLGPFDQPDRRLSLAGVPDPEDAESAAARLLSQRLNVRQTGPHGPIFTDLAGKPADAIAKLQREQTGEVPRVWEHPELGWIDLIWGDKRGGLAHMIRKHVEEKKDLRLEDLADEIPRMQVIKNDGRTARLESESHEAGVRLDFDGTRKRWLVTAYEKKPSTGGSPLVPGSPQPR